MSGKGKGQKVKAKARIGKPKTDLSQIKNRVKRDLVLAQRKAEAKKDRTANRRKRKREETEALARGETVAKRRTLTIDDMRVADDTFVAADDEEVNADEATDEFAEYFSGEKKPNIILTTKMRPSRHLFPFVREILELLPGSRFFNRHRHPLKKICEWGGKRGFTHVVVVGEHQKKPSSLLVVHLPEGPTAFFRLTSEQLGRHIHGHGVGTDHKPELILQRFHTRLGHRFGRLLGSLFPHDPDFIGRQVVTFHNQRDFVFVRRHRYIFTEDGKKARLQELGPRFTIKPQWMLAGSFDIRFGEFEWFLKRHDMETSRRKFFL